LCLNSVQWIDACGQAVAFELDICSWVLTVMHV